MEDGEIGKREKLREKEKERVEEGEVCSQITQCIWRKSTHSCDATQNDNWIPER